MFTVSPLSLGSWKTFDRLPRDTGIATLQRAVRCGIRFVDTARYDDDTGRAPMRTGWSEVAFGEAFRAAAIPRDVVAISTKLWWEFWPQQTAAEEIAASLERTGLEYFDLVYSDPPPEALPIADVVAAIRALLSGGKARAWGVVNWPAARIAEAAAAAAERGLPPMRLVQLPYNVVRRSPVEDAEMVAAIQAAGAGVVASDVLAGGALTGKYAAGTATGRLAAERDAPRLQPAFAAAPRLAALATEVGTTPAALAIAFTLRNALVETALIGATSPEQVAENATAVQVANELTPSHLAALRELGGG